LNQSAADRYDGGPGDVLGVPRHSQGKAVDLHVAVVALFGDFLLDRSAGGLFRLDEYGNRVPLPLGSRALDVLSVLVERHGDLVSKQTIMDSVWSDTVVEENNLTIQISTLRRVLDMERTDGSCIQTVPGRGYRFVVPVHRQEDTPRPLRQNPDAGIAKAPRLSLVVLPFANFGGNPDQDYLADAITEDVTTDLSRLPGALVIARQSAAALKGKSIDLRRVGEDLGVRYAVEGSVRRLGNVVRVNVQLISTETNTHIWADRFDQEITDLATGQEAIVCRIGSALGIEVVDAESTRSVRERATNPDAFDLVLRATSLQNQPFSDQRNDAAQELYEQALTIEPGSLRAILGLFRTLFLYWSHRGVWKDGDAEERAIRLLAAAQSIAPQDEGVIFSTVRLLAAQGKWWEMMAAAQRVIDCYPGSAFGYLFLARGKIFTGEAETAIPLLARTIELNPRDRHLWDPYWRTAFALQLIGRYDESITWHQRALAVSPGQSRLLRSYRYLDMASAWALRGHVEEARRMIAEVQRNWPFTTVRSRWRINPMTKTFQAQIANYREGLRLAGLRDHAEEDADFGVAPDAGLREEPVGYTPKTTPGVTTIRTQPLEDFVAGRKPVVVDTMALSLGQSIPGAVGLRNAGLGGNLSDATQSRLGRKMLALTGGDLNRAVVAVGWNSERFEGRNLALRLAALGYTNVYWYRGGREAWEVAGLPETELVVQEW
jgi:adenylate cyclase